MGNGLRRNIFQRRLLKRLHINKICGGFINIREKDNDSDAYKGALNAATKEVRKSKRNVEHKLAKNIKLNMSFYA